MSVIKADLKHRAERLGAVWLDTASETCKAERQPVFIGENV